MTPETSNLAEMVSDAAGLIRDWRSEIAEQWPPGGAEIDQEELGSLLQTGQAGGWDPQMVLWAVLGAEWLLRARPATHEDVEAEMEKIRNALLRGSSDPNHAVLIEEVAGRALRRELKRRRFLVSYRTFTVPSARLLMRLAKGSRPPTDSGRLRSLTAVQVRQGPIPKLGPIVAAVLVQGVAEQITGERISSDRFGLALAKLLLNRRILLPEFRKWKARLNVAIPDPALQLSEPERRQTLRDWLVFRFERCYGSMSGSVGWDDFCHEARHNPTFACSCVGDLQIARGLYALTWA